MFKGVMVRLMLVLAPVMCILSAIGISATLVTYMKNLDTKEAKSDKKTKKIDDNYPKKSEVIKEKNRDFILKNFEILIFFLLIQIATGIIFFICFLLANYTFHCTWVTSEAYSSPSIVLSAKGHDGGKIIFDDFREAYYWLRYNTPEVNIYTHFCFVLLTNLYFEFKKDSKVMSWWDYGYQITAMANRTILVDNNTWNNTHISRVGQVSLLILFIICISLFLKKDKLFL
jgi:dolichyl-diphosphooligosaccharide---protein glycosyltransferase